MWCCPSTFTIAWHRADDMPPGDEARVWLYGVARRVLANHLRGERRHLIKAAVLRDELAAAPAVAPAQLRDTPVAQAFGELPDGDYDTAAPITAPGEMLNGVDLTHRTVGQLRALSPSGTSPSPSTTGRTTRTPSATPSEASR
jgi:hypothetical protein